MSVIHILIKYSQAIQERRRSALRITEPLFPGGAPGLSPKKAKASPPFELLESQEAVSESLEDENLDAQGLLEKMRQTVEGIHRQSPVKPKPGIFTRSNSQQKPIPFSPFTAVTPASEKSASKTPGDDTPLADDEASPQGMENSLNEVSEESEDESLTTRRPRRVLRGNPDQKLASVPCFEVSFSYLLLPRVVMRNPRAVKRPSEQQGALCLLATLPQPQSSTRMRQQLPRRK